MTIALMLAPITGFALDSGGESVAGRGRTSSAHGEGPAHARPGAAPHARTGTARGRRAGRPAHASGPASARRARARRTGPRPPEPTWSRYVSTVDVGRMDRMGCGLGRGVRSGRERDDTLVVLAFGRPMHHKSRFGASIFDEHFANTMKVGWATQAYARGFAGCLGGHAAHLTLAAGTSNFGPDVSYRHGRVWGAMVNRVNRYLRLRGLDRSVTVAGANDIEPGWRGPIVTRRWIRGYASITDTPYYNFGGAAGCQPIGSCEGDWTMEDIWYAAWGSGVAVPLPEIYAHTGSNAAQWHALSLYSLQHHGSRMEIAGAMSQLQGCLDRHDRCQGIRNTPHRAWSQLWRALNSDPRTAQPLRYSTDISWRN